MVGERQSGIAKVRTVECEQHGRAVTNVTRGVDTQLRMEKCSDRKETTPRTQNNATNAWNFGSSPNNNTKSNSNMALPVFDYPYVTILSVYANLNDIKIDIDAK